jgi:hypothetical protein
MASMIHHITRSFRFRFAWCSARSRSRLLDDVECEFHAASAFTCRWPFIVDGVRSMTQYVNIFTPRGGQEAIAEVQEAYCGDHQLCHLLE